MKLVPYAAMGFDSLCGFNDIERKEMFYSDKMATFIHMKNSYTTPI